MVRTMSEEKNSNITAEIDFLYEMGAFRYLDRTWRQFLGYDFANHAEHTFRTAWIALTIAKHEGGDTEKVLKMALVHDVPESRCGDPHYLSRQYIERNEDLAAEDVFQNTPHYEEMRALLKEYHDRETLESKIVKDADNLDVDFELREQSARGGTLDAKWSGARKEQVYPKLFTETAKKYWQEIYKRDPHDWHWQSPRNRFNSGDWKKKNEG